MVFAVGLRLGDLSTQAVRSAVGLVLVGVGLFSLFRLVTNAVADPKPHGTRRGAAIHFIGCVLFGVGQLVQTSWLSIAVTSFAVLLMLLPWVRPKYFHEIG
jgi:ABC-type cobalamin transport system permease subunit